MAKEKQRETQINKEKLPFLGGKQDFPIIKQRKKRQIRKKRKYKKQKNK